MPLISIHTNQSVSEGTKTTLLNLLTELVATQLNKPKDYVQVLIVPDSSMAFAGGPGPTAFVELRSLGLPPDKPKPLSAAICGILQEQLRVEPDRVFLNFFDLPRPHWGWNSGTFG